MPLLMQIFPTVQDFKTIGDLGYLVIIALVAFILAVVLLVVMFIQLRQAMNQSKSDEKEDTRIDKLIDRLVEVFGTLQTEQAKSRQIIADNSETQRSVVQAATAQTGAIQEQTQESKLLRADVKSYFSTASDSYQQLEKSVTTTMVAFGEFQKILEQVLASGRETQASVKEAMENHKVMIAKLDQIIALFPTTPPAVTNNITNVTTPPPADSEAA